MVKKAAVLGSTGSVGTQALEVMRAENVPVNDLCALCREAPGLYKCADGLHLTEEGYRACARQVASCIERYL